MARKPLTFRGFNKGVSIKGDCFGEPGILRLQGFKFGDRPGCLESSGGFASWNTAATDWTFINGIKKWYREDGGSNYLVFGTQNGGVRRLWYFSPESKSVTSLADLSSLLCENHAPVVFVNCNSQILVLPLMSSGRPYSVKLLQQGVEGGILARPLGLDAPVNPPSVVVLGASKVQGSVNTAPANQIQEGTYKYAYSYSYGSKEFPEKFGESGLSPIAAITYPASLTITIGGIIFENISPDKFGIIQIEGWTPLTDTGIVRRINIYRSKRNETTLYKIGEIYQVGLTNWNDTIGDSIIDTIFPGKTAPIYTGLPSAMRCALWHPTFQRLYWFGMDGYFHWSAAGFADISPATQRMEVGSRGYYGNAVATIRNAIYGFKEDGIYLIQGEAPNYFSTRVSSVQCFSRSSVAELPDGIYFLGAESGKIKVFRFNGNTAVPITEELNDMLPGNKSSVFLRAFGERVGDEYWLSLMVQDLKFCYYPVPWNNVILTYDYRYQQWSGHFPVQASSIAVLDGPGDSGEVFITESDPTADVNKGNIFRFEKRSSKSSISDYWGGTRDYGEGNQSGIILVGIFPGVSSEDGSLEKILSYHCKVRVRGYLDRSTSLKAYEDDAIQDIALGTILPETTTLRKNDLVTTGVTACVVGTGTAGHATCIGNIVEDLEFTFVDNKHRTGVGFGFEFSREGRTVEIEAIEVNVETTDRE